MKEIIIYPNPQNSNHEKGLFFEKLVGRIMKNQRYKVKERINFTGMEIDLLCEHLDRNEKAFVECKAREDLSANDISKFIFDVQYQRFDYGYFLYIKNFQHQAGGIIEDIRKDDRYKNIYFWDCEKIIELLIDSRDIQDFNIQFEKFRIAKTILLYSYIGTFYILLLSNSTLSEYFTIYDATNLEPNDDKQSVDLIQKIVKDINGLVYLDIKSKNNFIDKKNDDYKIEVVAEIQESESWDDFKPASTKFFIGRKVIKEQAFIFFDKITQKETKNRIIYIEGKSGWGKSSLINELRGRSRNKYYKNKYFVFAVDSRSANSANFVALSFKKMIEAAVKQSFLKFNIDDLEILSNYDIISSSSVIKLLNYLEDKQKLLIIIFDQFEDVFRKGDLFKAFYKFLFDVRNLKGNLVVGFSWKSEINIPISHEAYYLWQQSQEYTHKLNIIEFDFFESKEIIKQLEKAINQKLDNEFIRKIADNSQGFPWLVKKLCVHIYNQVLTNVSIDILYEQDFNVESLFLEDLEGLTPDENRALNYIAKRAFEDNAFDITETDEVIPANIIDSLVLHRKLVIKSGSKYNIYWDIFRDYLVTGEIPKIGESYLIRSTVPPVLDMYLLFKGNPSLNLEEILNLMPIQKGTILNSLRLLRDIGLIKIKNDIYSLKRQDIGVSEEDFKLYIHEKLLKHTLYLEIQKREGSKIELTDLIDLIKSKFKGRNYSDRTLKTYVQDFINWLKFAEIETPQISYKLRLDSQNLSTFNPQNMPYEVIDYFKTLEDEQIILVTTKTYKILYDLKSIGLLTYFKNSVNLTEKGKKIKNLAETELNQRISAEALKTEKLSKSYHVFVINPNIKVKDFQNSIQDLLEGINSKVYQYSTTRNLYSWCKFINQNIGN